MLRRSLMALLGWTAALPLRAEPLRLAQGGGFGPAEGTMRDLGARVEGDDIVVDLPSDILFDFGKWNIRPDAAATLERLLLIINDQPGRGPVRIEGHTGSVGTDACNQRLSERRAASVRS